MIQNINISDEVLLCELENHLSNLLNKFYPRTIDKKDGGFLCNLTYDWKFEDPQDKMIVTQARHTWTLAKAQNFYPDDQRYPEAVLHGYKFLKEVMWDKEFGGFYTMRSAEGNISHYRGYMEEKRTYGNAFALYALAAVYKLVNKKEILDFAVEVFNWIEDHAYDPINKGYFQFLTREGNPFTDTEISSTSASDASEAPFKDQNSSIHLLEAYTEFYKIWPNEKLRSRLNDLLILIRDTITTEKGCMNLFFDHKWNPVSFRNEDKETRERNYGLDHVSFGHDYETAFLMLETSYALGIKDDVRTLKIAKRMVDHAIENGWDRIRGGFWDAGYYFEGSDECTIIRPVKNWWSQAEGLNALLLMSKIFPEEKKYYEYFIKLFEYINNYLIDHEFGGWYEGGLDKEPHLKYGLKSQIWKACYHESRSLMNCIKYLSDDKFHLYNTNKQFRKLKEESDCFTYHWQRVKENL